MREIIFQYLTEQEHLTEKLASQMCDKFEKNPWILDEVVYYIRNGEFPLENAVSVEGYTAQLLEQTTYLKPIGAYNYLIFLKHKPEEALEKLAQGLPQR